MQKTEKDCFPKNETLRREKEGRKLHTIYEHFVLFFPPKNIYFFLIEIEYIFMCGCSLVLASHWFMWWCEHGAIDHLAIHLELLKIKSCTKAFIFRVTLSHLSMLLLFFNHRHRESFNLTYTYMTFPTATTFLSLSFGGLKGALCLVRAISFCKIIIHC